MDCVKTLPAACCGYAVAAPAAAGAAAASAAAGLVLLLLPPLVLPPPLLSLRCCARCEIACDCLRIFSSCTATFTATTAAAANATTSMTTVMQVYIVQEWCDRNVRAFLQEPFYTREVTKTLQGCADTIKVALQLACEYQWFVYH